MREIRYLDKLIDELAKGKAMEKKDDDVARNSQLRDTMRQVARQAALDPRDGIEL